MNKLLVICGPTASGKTGLGIKLTKKFRGEIVSADSRQVYKGMDVGTGKDLPADAKLKIKNEKLKTHIKNKKYKKKKTLKPYRFQEIPVWLLDVVEPDCQFNVTDYIKCANLVIKNIWKRGKLPVLVGGTGFYIKGVVDGIGTIGIGQDKKLRKKLSNYPIIQLSNLLKKIDKKRRERMNESDRKNPRRLIRAIETARQIKNEKLKMKSYSSKLKINKTLFIGLTAENKILYERIDKRVEERAKEGIVEEIEELLKKGYSWDNSVLGQTIGYKEWEEYLKKSINQKINKSKIKEQTIQKWKYDEHGYARRQMTWFRKDKRVHWFDISHKGWENDLVSFLQKQESI